MVKWKTKREPGPFHLSAEVSYFKLKVDQVLAPGTKWGDYWEWSVTTGLGDLLVSGECEHAETAQNAAENALFDIGIKLIEAIGRKPND